MFVEIGGNIKMNFKIQSAIGTFWAASFFIWILIAVLIGFKGNGGSDWIFAIVVGALVFLILGLVIQGILTLFYRE